MATHEGQDVATQPKHIRPKIQRKSPKTRTSKQQNESKLSTEVEETVQKMESWMGLGTKKTPKPSGILKTPKYSTHLVVPSDNLKKPPAATSAVVVESSSPALVIPTDAPGESTLKSTIICKDVVVERDPTIATRRRKTFRKNPSKPTAASVQSHHGAIEGYVPSNTPSDGHTKRISFEEKTGKDEPLVIESLEELLKTAGHPMPENPDKITSDTQMLEANISFNVMTQDDYQQQLPDLQEEHEIQRQKHLEVFLGKRDIFDPDGFEDESSDDDDDSDDDAMMELLLGSDVESDNEDCPEPENRAFTLLWTAMSTWITPQTVAWMKALGDSETTTLDTEWTPMVDRSDIGASRCAGVLAMIRLYLGTCMDELHHPVESKRKAEKRLNDLLRTFDYSFENPKLASTHWKAMACVLLDAVLLETRPETIMDLPASVLQVGMTLEEFEYLSRKAVLTFG